MNNKKGFILSTYVYMLLVFFLLLLTTMLSVMNNTKLLSNKLKEQSSSTSGLVDKEFSFILLGQGDMIIKKGEEYIEPGFKIQTSKKKDLSNIVKITGNVDINIPNTYKLTYSATYNGITKKLTRNVTVLDNVASNYITGLYTYRRDENNLTNPKVTYEGIEYDTGIRYTGAMNEVKNQVYFNCEDKDANNVSYGNENYNYANSCEVWRIIGVFDVSNGTTTEKRVKIINTASTFKASWDSSADGTNEGEIAVNSGYGINQWGPSGDYEGADLMQLLNGYYIGVENSTCTYCNGNGQETCIQICDTESATLVSQNMKQLTYTAKGMIENAVWNTYGVHSDLYPVTSSNAPIAYLQEKGISTQYTGKSECEANGGNYCNDGVIRTTNWAGLVGLMSVADIGYANGWLYNQSDNSVYPWSISPFASVDYAFHVCDSYEDGAYTHSTRNQLGVWPSVYLKSDIKIIGGDGTQSNPYKLSLVSVE